MNRRVADLVADLHFAPTPRSAEALRREGAGAIRVTGNTVVDALYWIRDRQPPPQPPGDGLVLITSHRRESFGEPMRGAFRAIARLAKRFPRMRFVFPVHPNPSVAEATAVFEGIGNVELLPPASYPQLVSWIRAARLILTDSGGIQEEAPAFGVPTLVLRTTTERPEGVEAGVARLVGTDGERIFSEAERAADRRRGVPRDGARSESVRRRESRRPHRRNPRRPARRGLFAGAMSVPAVSGLSHRIRGVFQKLRPWRWLLLRLVPSPVLRRYHDWSVRLDFDPARYPKETLPPGLNVVGYLRSASGVGESGRSFVQAAQEAGIRTSLVNADGAARYYLEEDDSLGVLQRKNPFDVNLFCVNSDEMRILREYLGGRFFANRVNVGYWYWEFPELPASHRDRFERLDEIWVASEFVRGAVARAVPADGSVSVEVLPPHVALRRSLRKRWQLGLHPTAFIFLALADAGSVLSRKNPEGAIEAFLRAFGGSAEAQLILKINHPESDPEGIERLKSAARGKPIRVLDWISSREEIDGLLTNCDALVSLHRSEGFGLPCAEAMALGKPVIATDYSGTADFVSGTTAFPVPCHLVELPQAIGPYEKGAIWAEPDLDAAAHAMRRVIEDREEASRRGAAAADLIETRYGRAAVAGMLKRRLEILRSRRK